MFGRKKEKEVSQELHKIFKMYPYGTDEVVRVRDIVVPKDFEKHPPCMWKLKKCANFYRKFQMFDKPVTVIAETNEYGLPNKLLLVDGYVRLCVAKIFKFRKVPIRYIGYEDINTHAI